MKTYSFSQHEILRNIIRLYVPRGKFDMDPTYGHGGFYKSGVPKPICAYDIKPRDPRVRKGDCTRLPQANNSVRSIVFDPPFLPGMKSGSIMKKRFGTIGSTLDIEDMYLSSLREFYRILKPGGVLVFKCQDYVNGKQQKILHNTIINLALVLNFEVLDLFILLAKSRPYNSSRIAVHARKFHSYFIVFRKRHRHKRRPNISAGRLSHIYKIILDPEVKSYPRSTEVSRSGRLR